MPASPTYYLAFDLGASSGRAVVGTLEQGQMSMEVVHRFPTPLREDDGRLQWDAEALWRELQTGFAAARETAPSLRSLSVDSWAVDYVPLDADGTPLRDPYCYRDPVRNAVMAEALERVPPERIYGITGIQFLPFNTLYQVLADQQHDPDLLARTHRRLLIADYFNHRFGGRPVVDRSMASTTQAMDARTRQWSADLLDAFALPHRGWPEIVPCGTRIGTVTEAPEVAVVASCSHDTASAVAAVPAEDDGAWAYISCGTWSLMGVELPEPVLTDAARTAGFTNEAGLDGTIRFLTNLTGLWALQECVREWREAGRAIDYDTLTAEAAAIASPGATIDLDDDRFLGRGGMAERLRAYCREHDQPVPTTRAALTRAILDNIAASYRRTLDALERVLGRRIATIHLVGGGAQNTLLCQLTANACERRVVAGPVEATALGNLLVQARTMGDLPEGQTVRDVARASSTLTTYTPS
jgi:rhamnulokinase